MYYQNVLIASLILFLIGSEIHSLWIVKKAKRYSTHRFKLMSIENIIVSGVPFFLMFYLFIKGNFMISVYESILLLIYCSYIFFRYPKLIVGEKGIYFKGSLIKWAKIYQIRVNQYGDVVIRTSKFNNLKIRIKKLENTDSFISICSNKVEILEHHVR